MSKFVVKETQSGFHFVFVGGAEETIGLSETYTTKDACLKGLESVRKNAGIANVEDQTAANVETVVNPKFELYEDKAGAYRFRLKARNGENIFASEAFKEKAACKKAIEGFQKDAADAAVEG